MSNPPPPAPLPGLRLSVQSCIVWSWLMIAIVRFCHHLINPNIISKQQHKTQKREMPLYGGWQRGSVMLIPPKGNLRTHTHANTTVHSSSLATRCW